MKPWRLNLGWHKGTIATRDTITKDLPSLEARKESVKWAEEDGKGMGVQIWFAIAFGPDGERITLHEGNPYD